MGINGELPEQIENREDQRGGIFPVMKKEMQEVGVREDKAFDQSVRRIRCGNK